MPGSPDTEVKGDKTPVLHLFEFLPLLLLKALEWCQLHPVAPALHAPVCCTPPGRVPWILERGGWREGCGYNDMPVFVGLASRKENERGWKGDWPEIKMLAYVLAEILKGRAHLLCTGCKGAVAPPHFQARFWCSSDWWCARVPADCCFLCHWVWPQLGPAGIIGEELWRPLSEKIKMPREKKVQLIYTVPWFSFQYHWSLAVLDWCIVVALEDLPFEKKK